MKKALLFFTLFLFLIISCIDKPEEVLSPDSKSMEDISVPDNFNWETGKVISLDVSIESEVKYEAYYRIGIYIGNPLVAGQLLVAGSASETDNLQIQIGLPNRIDTIYLSCENPMGSIQFAKLPVSSNEISHTFNESAAKNIGQKQLFIPQYKSGPDCNSGCDETISGGGSKYISDGQVYCITGNFNGKIYFQSWNGGGTLRVCGTAIITNSTLSLASNCHIEIAEGATFEAKKIDMGNDATFSVYENAEVDIKKFNAWSENTYILNYGDITVDEDSYHRGALENHGSILYEKDAEIDRTNLVNTSYYNVDDKFTTYGTGVVVQNDGTFITGNRFELNSNTDFTNNGTVETGQKVYINENVIFTNYGTFSAVDHVEFNSSSQLLNYCQFTGEKSISYNSNSKLVCNNGFLSADEQLNFWTNTDVELEANSMLSANDIEIDCNITGSGSLNSIVIEDKVEIYGNSKLDGAIEMAISDGQLHSGSANNFINGAYFTSFENATNYLPISQCNPVGFGSPSVVDTDLDGVPDDMDDFPTDPERAFSNYYPASGSHVTFAFEDLWPSTGDYDFNDLVFILFGNEITNADNDLVEIYLNCVVEAVGASLNNGIGLQLDNITSAQIESATGMVLDQGYTSLNMNGTESGQAKAVIIITESVNDVINRAEGSMFNTIPENPTGSSDTVQLYIKFNSPIDYTLVSNNGYNPFLIIDQNRSKEIHLSGYAPTDLMDISFFGTGQDASDPFTNTYFVTGNNLPWGLMIMEPFDYPIEKAPIINAYNYFSSWAESGGTIYPNWYSDQPGYRSESEIYAD